MKNLAVKDMICRQYNKNPDEVDVEFVGSVPTDAYTYAYEFKVEVKNIENNTISGVDDETKTITFDLKVQCSNFKEIQNY